MERHYTAIQIFSITILEEFRSSGVRRTHSPVLEVAEQYLFGGVFGWVHSELLLPL